MDSCLCSELRAQAEARGRLRALDGLSRARTGDFAGGLTALREAASHGAMSSWVLEAAGLCALAVGDPTAARSWWQAAVANGAERPARGWLASLESGEIRAALESYNGALSAARAGDYEGGVALLAKSRELLPDFGPSQRLEALLARAIADHHAVPARNAHVRGVRRVMLVATVLATTAGAFWAGLSARRPSPAPTASSSLAKGRDASPAPRDTRVGPDAGYAIGVALTMDPDSIAALAARVGADTTAWPSTARLRLADIRVRSAQRHFSRGLSFVTRGAAGEAAREFTAAARLGAGTYLEDDALYELARAQERVGAETDAASTAAHLLSTFPRSIFSNSTMRSLASGTLAGEPR